MMSAEDYTMLVAHEFFDAMPINLFEVRFASPPPRDAPLTGIAGGNRMARNIRRCRPGVRPHVGGIILSQNGVLTMYCGNVQSEIRRSLTLWSPFSALPRSDSAVHDPPQNLLALPRAGSRDTIRDRPGLVEDHAESRGIF